jgi:hypothetical protein
MSAVYVPVHSAGLGTGNITILDARTGEHVVFRCPTLALVGGVLHVPAVVVDVAAGLYRVAVGARAVWVEAVLHRPDLDAAA